jgi:hypothetical protein
MNTQLNQQQEKVIDTSAIGNRDCFNFELWASEVRRQMLASLQKKDSEREARIGRKNHS